MGVRLSARAKVIDEILEDFLLWPACSQRRLARCSSPRKFEKGRSGGQFRRLSVKEAAEIRMHEQPNQRCMSSLVWFSDGSGVCAVAYNLSWCDSCTHCICTEQAWSWSVRLGESSFGKCGSACVRCAQPSQRHATVGCTAQVGSEGVLKAR